MSPIKRLEQLLEGAVGLLFSLSPGEARERESNPLLRGHMQRQSAAGAAALPALRSFQFMMALKPSM